MAHLPLPGADQAAAAGRLSVAAVPPEGGLRFEQLPEAVVTVLDVIAEAGHEVTLVGGCVRDRLLDLEPIEDWDAATSARPEEVASLFGDATWENRFGTVTIGRPPTTVEVTSYRAEGGYRDRRRPDDVRFGVCLTDDLARRDFTVNAMAWMPVDLRERTGTLVDPFGGAQD